MGDAEASLGVSKKGQTVITIINYVAIILFALATCVVLFVAISRDDSHNDHGYGYVSYSHRTNYMMWHAILSTVGCLLLLCSMLMPQGCECAPKCAEWFHLIMGAVGSLVLLIGIVLQTCDYTYYSSVHGDFGIASMFFILVVIIFGILVACKVSFMSQSQMEFTHNFLGLLSFILGSCALCYGVRFTWFLNASSGFERLLVYVFVIIAVVWLTVLMVWKLYKNYIK